MAKPSKSSGGKKKKSKANPNAIAKKKHHDNNNSKPNLFETISSRRKFDIVGQKRKGDERRLGQARSRGIQIREKTLLKEYVQSRKASVFSDKRIGEQDESIPEFDKAILRSQRERQKKLNKTSKYNLSDGEEEELDMFGGGADDFHEDFEHGSDDEDFQQAGDGNGSDLSNRLKLLHARNAMNGEDENRPKSKKEVMDEVILKSKFYKAQKAKEKEENEKLVDELDKDFESLVQSQAFSSLTQASKMNALKALVSPNFSTELKSTEKTSLSTTPKKDEADTYEQLVNEVMMEIRARPSDRKKTAEEIAEEEKERLERMEQERQDRMLAAEEASDEDHDDSVGIGRSTVNMTSHISGDDLGDSFTIDDKPQTKKGWVDEILERDDGEDTEDEDGSSDDSGDTEDDEGDTEDEEENDGKAETSKDWEQSDDDVAVGSEFDSDEEDGQDDGEKDSEAGISDRMLKRRREMPKSDKDIGDIKQELPFKIDAPTSMQELNKLFGSRCNEEIIEAIRRIRVYNAIALAAENRKKMQVFYGLLLQYFATLANEKPLNLQLLNLLVKPLVELSTEIPYFSAICARERLLRTRTKFCEDVKDPDKSCWPSLKTLFLLRLWSVIFPCSDFRHTVMTPAILLMCEYLMRCPVLTGRDAVIGSFLCSLVLSVIKQSKKFCPEALIFLKTILLAALDRDLGYNDQNFQHLLELKAPIPVLRIQEHVADVQPLDFLKIMNLPEDSPFFNTNEFRASAILSVVETLRGFIGVYGDLKAFPETFLPISALLAEVANQKNVPVSLQEKLRDVAELTRRKAEEHHGHRRPLQMRKQKPVPLKLLNPKFEENFVKGRDYDPDRERAENRKMKNILRKTARAAARELRKDNYYLQSVKEKDKKRVEEERAEKYGKARAFLQEQEHAYKSGQLGKGKKRGRA